MKVLFTCGGTGGHIYPAIAMYHEFKKRCVDFEYLFVGSDYGLEKEIFISEGIPFELIQSRGISRSLSLSNIKSAFFNLISFFQASKVVNKFKPDIVISTGAYPTFHTTFYAVRKHIPVFLIESNILPGFVTKLFSNKAQKVFVTSASTANYLKDPSKAEIAGTPSRIIPPSKSKEQIMRELNLNEKDKTVIVVGGSCGAEKLNQSILELLRSEAIDFNILWATGKKFYADIKKLIPEDIIQTKNIKIRVVDYIENMNEALKIADLIICRAGAMTIQEIKEYRIPAILVPFAKAAGNHQFINALELEKAGCAQILDEKTADGGTLYNKITSLLTNDKLMDEMKSNYKSIISEDANSKIFQSIMREMGWKNC